MTLLYQSPPIDVVIELVIVLAAKLGQATNFQTIFECST